MSNSEKCLNPKCDNPTKVRGVCWTCYNHMQRLVTTGQTTWDKLEESGVCLPRQRQNHTAAREWIDAIAGVTEKKRKTHAKAKAAGKKEN